MHALMLHHDSRLSPCLQYLLVVATTASVNGYAVTFDDQSVHGRMHIRPTPFSVRTDGVVVDRIVGTAEGRIFCAGRDGSVHEVVYSDPTAAAASGLTGIVASAAGLLGSWVRSALSGADGSAAPSAKRARRIAHEPSGDRDGDGGGGAWSLGSLLRAVTASVFSPAAVELEDLLVDHDRRLLYARGSDGSLRLYDYGAEPADMHGKRAIAATAAVPQPPLSVPGGPLRLVALIDDIEAACHRFCDSGAGGAVGAGVGGGAYVASPHNAHRPAANTFVPNFAARALAGGAAGAAAAAAGAAAGGIALAAGAVSPLGAAWPVASMHVIPPSVSAGVHLALVSASGVRIYLSTLAPHRYNMAFAGAAALGLMGVPGQAQAGIYDGEGAVGSALTVVHIALPPPAAARAAYTAAGSPFLAPASSAGHDPIALPSAAASPLARVVTAHVGSGVSLMAVMPTAAAAAAAGAGAGAGGAAGGGGGATCRLIGLATDSLEYPRAGGMPGAGGAGARELCVRESVQEVQLPPGASIVHAVGEEPCPPSLWQDSIYTAAGALSLPERETCVAPAAGDAAAVRQGVLPPKGSTAAKVPDVRVARDAARALGPGPGGAGGAGALHAPPKAPPTLLDLASSMVPQAQLEESGTAPRFHHVMRRRLWEAGRQIPVPEASLQLPDALAGDASLRVFVVLTDVGVFKLARRRLIDQVASVLRNYDPAREGAPHAPGAIAAAAAATGAGGLAAGAALADAPAAANSVLLAHIPVDELFALLAALACGAPDLRALATRNARASASRGVPGSVARAAGTPSGSGLADVDAVVMQRAAVACRKLMRVPSWNRRDGHALPAHALYGPDDLLFSPQAAGLFLLAARMLRPFAAAACFTAPPGSPPGTFPKDSDIPKAVKLKLLPRYTPGEATALRDSLAALSKRLAELVPFAQRNAEAATLITVARTNRVPPIPPVGVPSGVIDGPLNPADGGAMQLRANCLEMQLLVGLQQFATRATQVAALLAAISHPLAGGAAALQSLSSDKVRQFAQATLSSFAVDGGPALDAARRRADAMDPADPAYLALVAAAPHAGAAGGAGGHQAYALDLMRDSPGRAVAKELASRLAQSLSSAGALDASAGAAFLDAGGLGGFGGGIGGAVVGFAAVGGDGAVAIPALAGTGSGASAGSVAAAAGADPASRLGAQLLRECPSFFSEGWQAWLNACSRLEAALGEGVSPRDRAAALQASQLAALRAVQCMDAPSLAAELPSILSVAVHYCAAGLGDYTGCTALVSMAGALLAGGAEAAGSLPDDYTDVAAAPLDPGDGTGLVSLFRNKIAAIAAPRAAAAAGGAGGAGGAAGEPPSYGAFAKELQARRELAPPETRRVTELRLAAYCCLLGLLQAARDLALPGAAGGANGDRAAAELVQTILRVPDALLHYTVFRWLESQGMLSFLTEGVASPHLEAYLTHHCAGGAGEAEQLLVRYLRAHMLAGRAARTLARLATQDTAPAAAALAGGAGVGSYPRIDRRVAWLQEAVDEASRPREAQGIDSVTASERDMWADKLVAMNAQTEVVAALQGLVEVDAAGAAAAPGGPIASLATRLAFVELLTLRDLYIVCMDNGLLSQALFVLSE